MNHQPIWEPTDSDLVAYLLDDLEGARAEYVAAHLEQCRPCRERLTQLEQVIGCLESMPDPGSDDFQQRIMLKARIQLEAASIAQSAGIWMQRTRIGAAAVALIVIIVIGPLLTGAGSASIRELVGVDPDIGSPANQPRDIRNDLSRLASASPTLDVRPTIDQSELPYAPIAPAELPGSNQLVDDSAFADGSFEAIYEGTDGLKLSLRQEPATTDGVSASTEFEFQELQIGDVRAIIVAADALNSVDQIYWVRGGTFFSLRAIRLTADDFPVEEATRIVERLIELQDHPESSANYGRAPHN